MSYARLISKIDWKFPSHIASEIAMEEIRVEWKARKSVLQSLVSTLEKIKQLKEHELPPSLEQWKHL